MAGKSNNNGINHYQKVVCKGKKTVCAGGLIFNNDDD
tara:strand:+ start:2182 stop:2292 length:111 start_codon:yes stop_codon:yes gene_type:complete